MINKSCESLPGVGPILAAKLAQCGIHTIQDLLFHLPYRYQDRTHITPIQDLRANDWCVIVGHVCKTELVYGKRKMLNCWVEDKTGLLKFRFFHFNQQQIKQFQNNKLIRAFGEVREFASQLEMIHPEYQFLEETNPCVVEETLTPIYSTTHGLSQTRLRQLVKLALQTCQTELHQLEWMTEQQRQQHAFQSLPVAISELHHPPPHLALQALENGQHAGIQRLAFDELLAQRLSMQFARKQRAILRAPLLLPSPDIMTQFLTHLPFQLTAAQHRVCLEISQDLQQEKPMLRLIQGDVGAGKTLVAVLAALQAIANGYQVSFMAPTDILSEQHLKVLQQWLTPLGIIVMRLSGKMKTKERRETLSALQTGACQLIVGTHALFQEEVTFAKLGLIIIDEQHRFGVEQRLLLSQKGHQHSMVPHQLLMTATPIPRTLAMTQFAHIDLSIIDELPPGRTPIITAIVNQEKRDQIIERLQAAIQAGRQVYWVCTLIDESEKLQCIAATSSAQQLQVFLPSARIGLVHGRLNNDEKTAIMLAFKQGQIDLLVATTVIEVGVDVANASLMIIENAERLGLAQLHQLRGRVGRGHTQSHCLLLYQAPLSPQSKERLRVIRDTCDGFIIAEKDLALRGAGEILGVRQTGYRPFKIAALPRDHALLPKLNPMAQQLLAEQPELAETITKRWHGEFEHYLQG